MPPTSRQKRTNHRSRARLEGLRPGDPYFIAFLGFLLLVAGGLFVWSGLVLTSGDAARSISSYGRAFVGLGLMAAGVACWVPLGRRHRRTGAGTVVVRASDLAPWEEDYPWDRSGIASDLDEVSWFPALWLWVGSIFAIPLLLADLLRFKSLGVGALVLLAPFWAKTLFRFARRMKFGPSRLRFVLCPYPLGSELLVYLEDLDRLKEARSLTATLRFVAEEMEGPTAAPVAQGWTRYSHFEEVRTFEPRDLPFGSGAPARFFRFVRPADPEAELPIRFDLPGEGDRPKTEGGRPTSYETCLGANPVQYWELEVRADLPGIDYLALFLLPVYPPALIPLPVPERPAPRRP